MESPREEEEEEETQWWSREEEGPREPPAACKYCVAASGSPSLARRVILHLDMDCFYAQVEMIRNPELREKPLGVQQKTLMVTCNYVARNLGVNKCMSIREAREKCPQLVLVSGEDLTHYREMSYKVTSLLEEFGPRVERLGFDENFIDITELVEKRLRDPQCGRAMEASGHVYNQQVPDANDWTHQRLIVGSHVAADIRAAVYSRLGLTGCAGVASNKLLSKLVSGTFKPNQQTVLLPESCSCLINSLNHVHRIPGIGYKTAERLEALGLGSVSALQSCPITVLEKELGAAVAHRIQMLSRGEDNSLVTPTGPPQSLSEEDSFKKCCTVSDVRAKLEELLRLLLSRLSTDGRSAHTLRLTIRQFTPTNKYLNRESRQCPIPVNVAQSMNQGSDSAAIVSALMELLMKLFQKMIDVKLPFHLTLLNVCFSNLKASRSSTSSRCSIGFYLTQKKSSENDCGVSETSGFSIKANSAFPEKSGHSACPVEMDGEVSLSLPEDIDMDVFSQLPDDIKKEIIQSPHMTRRSKTIQTKPQAAAAGGIQNFFTRGKSGPGLNSARDEGHSQEPLPSPLKKPLRKDSESLSNVSDTVVPPSCTPHTACPQGTEPNVGFAMDCTESVDGDAVSSLPKSVDVNVFSQLPVELQKELMSEWKNQKLTPKIQTKKFQDKGKTSKGQRPSAASHPNSLLKYFKPN
ncbi:DNA polymerase iota-like isoform X1 [Bufo gargarizans]|uniref:DNA polymerase iota-like isoform X1 n=2 Tax=Bufo gargarizans TaxID=30331 RepID=UPI001CF24A03|nr:DNA polymerase iota-like isoform X1 [Bufo gargarizans]